MYIVSCCVKKMVVMTVYLSALVCSRYRDVNSIPTSPWLNHFAIKAGLMKYQNPHLGHFPNYNYRRLSSRCVQYFMAGY